MKLYKFTDRHYMTRNNTWWGEGVTHKLPTRFEPSMCSNEVIHAFDDINIAFLTKDMYFPKGEVIWLCEGDVVSDDGVKVGCFELTTLEQLMYPDWIYWDKDKKKKLLQTIYHREVNKYFLSLNVVNPNYNLAKEIYDTYNIIHEKNGFNWCREYETLTEYIIFKYKSWEYRANLNVIIYKYILNYILDMLRMIKFNSSTVTYFKNCKTLKETFCEVYEDMSEHE